MRHQRDEGEKEDKASSQHGINCVGLSHGVGDTGRDQGKEMKYGDPAPKSSLGQWG